MSNELAPREIGIEGGLVKLSTMTDALAFCDQIFKSGLCPSSFKNQQSVFLCIQTGAELQLSPMQSLQGLYAFNGRIAMMENCARGVAHHSGQLESIEDRFEGSGDDLTAICTIRRKGISNAFTGHFSVADAKRAKLWDKEGPWRLYPKDMLKKKASARALRDAFSDVLIGLPIKEDIEDLLPEKRESVNQNPVSDPLISSLPPLPDEHGEIVDAEIVPDRVAIVEIPPSEPCADLEEMQSTGPKVIEGELSFAKSKNEAYWNIRMGGKYFSWKHAANVSTTKMVEEKFKSKHRKFRLYYTEQPWESNGKSGVNNVVSGIEAI